MSESDRLAALAATNLLDTEVEERFDRLTRLATNALGAEVALISLIDENRQWFKSANGTSLKETPREFAFCDHAIRQDDVMVVPDATNDARFKANPLVTDGPEIRFYAGAPLLTENGHALGTLCVIDSEPRNDFSDDDKQLLRDIAASVMTEIEVVTQQQILEDLSVVNEELRHRMGNMYAHVSALITMIGRDEDDKDKLVRRLRDKVTTLGETQKLLAANQWVSVPMGQLINQTIKPFVSADRQSQVQIQNDDDFELSPRGAFIMTLVLSELGTNALKHGVLRNGDGQLNISWHFDEAFSFKWQEITNHTVTTSLENGYGSQILKRIAPMYLKGHATHILSSDGLIYDLTAQIDLLQAGDESASVMESVTAKP